MNNSQAFSKWSVALVVLSVMVIAVITLTQPTQAQNPSPASSQPALGLVRAVVVDVQDPDAKGRIKVKFPWLPRDVETWARVSLPLGGTRTGLLTLPEIGDEVVIGFEHGDVRNPIVLGFLWSGNSRTPTPTPSS